MSVLDGLNKEQREAEVEKLTGKAAKADHIASRTIRAINVKVNEDPIYYKNLSALIRETIETYRLERITEAEYLRKVKEFEAEFLSGKRNNVPDELNGNDTGIAIYNLVKEIFKEELVFKTEIARIFLNYSKIDVDKNLVLTACLLSNCKKVDNAQDIESIHTYAKNYRFVITIFFK